MVARRSRDDFDSAAADPDSSQGAISPTEAALRRELKARTEEVEALRHRLEELNTSGGKFLSAAAHELKTPLTVIQSYLEIMLSDLTEGLSTEQTSFLRIIFDSVLRLRSLILDLIDLAALETGSMQFDNVPTQPSKLLEKACQDIRDESERAGLELAVDLEAQSPRVRVDPNRMLEVLRRLLENAVKFTPAGGSIVARTSSGAGEVTLAIEDSGVGIPSDRIDGIFEEFVQVHRRPGERRQGSGLGLAICRRMVHACGGDIVLESTLGEGTTVKIRLPAHPETG